MTRILRTMRSFACAAFAPSFFVVACGQSQEPPPASPQPAVAEIPAPPSSSANAAPASSSAATPQEQPAKKETDAPRSVDDAIAQCIERDSLAPCVPFFKGGMDSKEATESGAKCTSTCIAARDQRLKTDIENALAVCKEHYVKSGGKTPGACQFPKSKKKRDPRELSMRFQDALRTAGEKNDAASLDALDATLVLLDADYLATKEPDCTKRCRAEGAAALKAGAPSKP